MRLAFPAAAGPGPDTPTGPPLILVVEDEHDIAALIALQLRALPARVTLAHDGLQGRALALARPWAALVLDLRLPGLGGLDLCRAVRQHTAHLPILMLTARSGESDRVLGLELGADDYLCKPFGVVELQARVRALLRRAALGPPQSPAAGAALAGPDRFEAGALRILRSQRRVWLDGQETVLTPREFDLLWHFACHPGRVFTRDELLTTVWGPGYDGYEHTVNSHINRLRGKLGDARSAAVFIHTIWGVGYRFEVPA